nr:MAG TPA: Pulmonary surfactant-associated protein D, c-type lectin, alpha-helical coiled [Caudoviricetes sp.]
MARIRLGNLKGPKGDRGEAGPRGPQGIQGPPGTADNIDLTPFVKKTEGATLTGQYTFTNNTPIKLNGYNVVSENNRILFKNADNNNVFAFDANTITHDDKSLLTQDKANTLYAPIGDYALRTALNSYATKTDLNNYVTTANANNTYAKKTDLNSYAANSTLSNYVTTANANSTYLSKTDANTIYAKKTDIGNALTLTQANDAYVSKAGDNNVTGTINISQTAGLTLANHILESNPTNLVIKNKANQPILTIYPSVAYLNGREVLNQFKADQLYAPKSALSNYVTTSQYNNDMNSLLTALRNVNN